MENWRCVESYTSYKEEVTRIVDCDDYTSGMYNFWLAIHISSKGQRLIFQITKANLKRKQFTSQEL